MPAKLVLMTYGYAKAVGFDVHLEGMFPRFRSIWADHQDKAKYPRTAKSEPTYEAWAASAGHTVPSTIFEAGEASNSAGPVRQAQRA